VRGRFAVCRMPGSRRVFDARTGKPQPVSEINYVPYLGSEGWLGVVPRSSASPEAAFGLLAELSAPAISGEILLDPAWAGGVFRRAHFHLLESGDPFGLTTSRQHAWIEALRQTVTPSAINPVVPLRPPDQRLYEHALAEELRRALRERKDPQ